MNEMQESLFKILVEFDDICSEHGIEYFLAFGAALGAVRNQCFLPWDDDLDVLITRDNWNKLLELINENPEILPENSRIACNENDKFYRNPLARYVDSSTTYMVTSQAIAAKSCGNLIDIFIIDPLPNVEDGQKEHLKQMQAFLEVLSPHFFVSEDFPIEDYEEHQQLVFKYLDEIEKRGFDEVIQELYEKLYSYPMEKADWVRIRWGIETIIHKSSFYSKQRYVELEGHKFPTSHELERSFRIDYGDSWMYVPEGDNQIAHYPFIVDQNHPFEDFSKIYLKHINPEKIIKAYEGNKRNSVDLWKYKKYLDLDRNKIRGLIDKKNIEKTVELNNYDLNQLLKDKEFELIDDIFKDYYTHQFYAVPKRYSSLHDLGDDLFKVTVESKIRQGTYFTGRKVLDIIEHNRPMGNELLYLKDVCEYCRTLSVAIYDDFDVEKVEETLKKTFDGFENLIDTYRARLWLLAKKSNNDDDYRNLIAEANKMLSEYPEDGEIMAYIAGAYYLLGDQEKSFEMYRKAVDCSRNGFVWQFAKKHAGIDRMKEEEIYVNQKKYSA
ncbi:phosphorylcholine transferase LicD [Methanobrevibacter sp.]|uniref:LicD family protein n=1 Tax=Methanobrevibacter sp. TaxID=66852 RepID=UPI0025ED43B0|nr:LicD family protein [Methanobrevibacter sp.]MBQ6512843.1 LicD family protein [Methanobrevibacter sp.]